MTFYRRRITIDEAWSLTSGRFWTLFGAYFVMWVILLLVFGTLFWVTMGGSYFAMMSQVRSDPARAQEAMAAFTGAQAQVPMVMRILLSLVWAVASAIGLALWPGTLASATRELLLEQGEVLEDDAESTAAIFE
jgi:cation transport ATPase